MTEGTDESLAKALGCDLRRAKGADWSYCGCPRLLHKGEDSFITAWSDSFDTCLRDIVPVLDARGIGTTITMLPGGFAIVQMFVRNAGPDADYLADCGPKLLPAAFCEAALKALVSTSQEAK